MLDINFIREKPEIVKKACEDKNFDPAMVDNLLSVDKKRRELMTIVENLRSQKNKLTREQVDEGKKIKIQLKEEEPKLRELEEKLKELLLSIPNPPADDVPIGKNETGNVEIKVWGEIKKFPFKPKTHDELAKGLDLFDSKRAVKIAGNRAYFLKNDLVILERALLDYSLQKMQKLGFTVMTVPWMVNREALVGTGYFPWGEDDHYKTQDNQGLIGTAEVSLTAYHQDEVLNEKDLPVKLCGISPCFRREVGSYGKDTQGFFRIHQFTKVEMVVLTVADEEETRKMHDSMREISESLLQELGLPYHVLLMCSGDMGAGQRRKYDIETWFPGQGCYRETHSDSYFNDFQARRLNIKYRSKAGDNKYVFTLTNTVAASPRLLAAILENYQTEEGFITVPQVLQNAMGKKVIDGKP